MRTNLMKRFLNLLSKRVQGKLFDLLLLLTLKWLVSKMEPRVRQARQTKMAKQQKISKIVSNPLKTPKIVSGKRSHDDSPRVQQEWTVLTTLPGLSGSLKEKTAHSQRI